MRKLIIFLSVLLLSACETNETYCISESFFQIEAKVEVKRNGVVTQETVLSPWLKWTGSRCFTDNGTKLMIIRPR